MSLYDNYRQAQTGYTSQFVGSILPELNQYSQVVQQRYNQAADQDDSLREALGNLQHLNFEGDSQYANELKEQYYQRLVDRSGRGDFENMGRRTRMDAARFAQAYQPLIQRQKDFAEIIKKVNSDPNVSDPNKKQQILAYISHMNTLPKTQTGDYQRDANGRIQLGGIQDWAYAPDVDVDKKLSDILSKKEADIKQSGYASDGQGLKISSIEELRSPAVMARLARQMMQNDPEIKAMFNRDVTLRNYQYSDNDVASELKQQDVSLYKRYKQQGLSDKQIAALAKSEGLSKEDLTTPAITKQRKALMDSGMSEAAANRAIQNNLTMQSMIEPHANFIGNLLAVDKQKIDAREDGLFLLHAKKAMDDADNGSFQILSTPAQSANALDASKVTTDYATKANALKDVQTNVNAAILQGMKRAGVATGDPKKDLAMAAEYANNRSKLNQLKSRLVGKDPELAGRLEVTQNNYLQSKSEVEHAGAMTKAMEETAGLNLDKLYQQYLKGDIPGIGVNIKDDKPVSKDQFIDALRNGEHDARGFISAINPAQLWKGNMLRAAIRYYDDRIGKGADAVNGGHTRLDTYNTIEPTSSGYVKNATDLINDRAKIGAIRLKELGSGDGKEGTLAELMGVKQKNLIDPKSDEYKLWKETQVNLNTRWNGGQPTLTARQPDGTSKTFTVTNPEGIAMMKEVQSRLVKQAMMNKTSEQAKGQAQDLLLGLGESTMSQSVHDLAGLPPSSVRVPINDKFAVRVKNGGPFGKTYEVYTRETNQLVKKFTTPDDIAIALGTDEYQRISAQQKAPQ